MSYNILLVEDEAGIAEGIMDYMKESEITFTWAADGDEALLWCTNMNMIWHF